MLRNVKESELHGQRQDFLCLMVSQWILIKFWYYLGTHLVDVLKASYLDSFLPSFPCKVLVNFIFKKCDRLDSRNWRPITLQNVDYKLSARTLAACLLQFIPFVVHSDQTCNIPGRYMVKMSLLRSAAIFSLDQ